MNTRLYVGNLPPSATDEDLKVKFARSGTVCSAVVAMDANTGRSRRFGFVEMSSHAEAMRAIGLLNMTQFDETIISVSPARIDQQP